MDFIRRLFGKKPAASDTTDADRARSRQMAGRETGQTAEEQAGTRGRMEAELDAQRERRTRPPADGA